MRRRAPAPRRSGDPTPNRAWGIASSASSAVTCSAEPPGRRRAAPRTAPPRPRPSSRRSVLLLGAQLLDALVGVVEVEQPRRRTARPRRAPRRSCRRTCGSARSAPPAAPRPPASRAGSVSIRGGVRRDVGRDVGEQVGELREPVGQLAGLRVVLTHPVEQRCAAAHGRSERVGRPSSLESASRACSAAVRSVSAKPSRVSSAASATSSPGSGDDRLDLAQPEAEQVGLLGALAGGGRPPRRARPRSPRAGRAASAYVASSSASGAPPNRSSASRWAAGRSSRCWSDWPCTATSGSATCGERRDRHRGAADEGARSALGRRRCGPARPASSSTSPPASSTAVGEAGSPSTRTTPSTRAVLAPGADRAGVGATAEQQAERGHDHRLAGAGLTGDHRQPGAELERRTTRSPPASRSGSPQASVWPRAQPPAALGRAAPALDRQAELGHQPVGERRLVQPHQADRRPRRGVPRSARRAAGRRCAGRRTTARRRRRCGPAPRPRAREVGRHDQRSREQRVRADRHHQQRLDPGPDHRAAGAEVVRRRAGRRRTHDAVAAPPRQRSTVDLDDHLEHPLAGGLLDAGLVERPGPGRRPRRRGGRSRRA